MTARALLEWFYDDLGDLVADYSDGPEPADFFAKARVTAQINALGLPCRDYWTPNGYRDGYIAPSTYTGSHTHQPPRMIYMCAPAYKAATWNWHEVAARADMLGKGEPRGQWLGYSGRLCRDFGRPDECRASDGPKDGNRAGCWTGDNVGLWGTD